MPASAGGVKRKRPWAVAGATLAPVLVSGSVQRRDAGAAPPARQRSALDSGATSCSAISEQQVSTDSEGPKPATRTEVSTDPAAVPRPGRAPSASACEPYRELIAEALGRGRNAM